MKKRMQAVLIVLLCSLAAFVLARFDAALYQQPVGQVTKVQNMSQGTTKDEHDNEDENFQQKLTVKVLNRSDQVVHLQNDWTKSATMSTKYRKGDQLLLKESGHGYQIDQLKRDAVLAMLVTFFFGLLLCYVRFKKSSWLLLSLLVNAVLFWLGLVVDVKVRGLLVLPFFSGLAVLLAALSLVFVLGRRQQALVTWLATVLTTALSLAALALVMRLTGGRGVHFETMSYVTQVPAPIFYSQAVIGILGAVMDESSDIVAGLYGLHRENPNRPFLDYWRAGRSIGQEILGTLTNVLFMIFIAETVPMVILLLRNGNQFGYILDQVMNLGILQTVVSALGIVWAVPVTAFIAAFFLRQQPQEEGSS
ncbi:YibE/F family protein [Leuconostocaceae bacterium ESL0958]|nr:YibE/F family protein [Leuconostocaceae bacterium ESL0958]